MRRILFILLLFLTTYCVRPDNSMVFSFENNSSIDVDFLCPIKYTYAVPFVWGTMYDLDANDTTSTGAWRAHFAWVSLLPESRKQVYSGYNSIEEMSPYDTVRIFVFDGRYHYLPYYERNQDEIFESEDYLCRYDFTSKDLYDLVDPDGNIKISFPPSIAMSKVKMFPKYEEVNIFNKE